MKLKRLWIDGFKNLNNFEIDFTDKDGITVLIGNNGSGKSNILEAISSMFTALYKMGTPQRKPKFEYEIEYILEDDNYHLSLTKSQNNDMIYNFHKNLVPIQVGHFKSNYIQYLPLNIIAIYSGEEMRLWEDYYKHSYNDFMKDVKGNLQSLSSPKLTYINKYYWNISLLSLLYSELPSNQDFCKRILDIDNLSTINITMKFNMDNISNFSDNSIVSFVKSLNLNNEVNKVVSIEDLRNNQLIGSEKDLFLKLMASLMDKASKYKLIEEITITFKSDLTTELLSEGEKKQILIRTALEVIADTNSLILLDEPDSHIHVANKTQLKDMLLEYDNRNTILTTHSPTLTHHFDDKHITMINNGKVEDKTKQEIFSHISDGIWNYQEQSVFLSSAYPIDLLVEGKFDKIHIEKALSILENDFPHLKCGIFDLDGCNKQIKLFDAMCNAKNLQLENKKIIFIFDNEKQFINAAGKLQGKEFKDSTKIIENIYIKNNMYIVFLPKKDGHEENFTIENMYNASKYKECLSEAFDFITVDKCNDFIDNISDNIKETSKKLLADKCKNYNSSDFEHFKKLFNLIEEIRKK